MKLPEPKLIALQVTSSNYRTYKSGDRPIFNGFNMFVKSNLSDVIDAFFNDNKIYSLRFKCKTWTKLKNFVSKIESKHIHSVLELDETATVKYSHKAGCSCGCSPGFRIRNASSRKDYMNHDVWSTISFDTSEFEKVLPKFKEMLETEIKSH